MNFFSEQLTILTDIDLFEWIFIALFIWFYPISFYDVIAQILEKGKDEMGYINSGNFIETDNSFNEIDRTEVYILEDGAEMII